MLKYGFIVLHALYLHILKYTDVLESVFPVPDVNQNAIKQL